MDSDTVYGAIAILGWSIAAFGPPTVAVRFLETARRVRPSWPIHLAFLPCVLAVEWVGLYLLGFGMQDDGYSPPGLGLLAAPAIFSLMLSIACYFLSLAIALFKRLTQQS